MMHPLSCTKTCMLQWSMAFAERAQCNCSACKPSLTQLWYNPGQMSTWPKVIEIGLRATRLRVNSTDTGETSSEFDWIEFKPVRPNLDRIRPMLARKGPELRQTWLKVGPSATDVGRTQFGQIWPGVDQSSAEFRRMLGRKWGRIGGHRPTLAWNRQTLGQCRPHVGPISVKPEQRIWAAPGGGTTLPWSVC